MSTLDFCAMACAHLAGNNESVTARPFRHRMTEDRTLPVPIATATGQIQAGSGSAHTELICVRRLQLTS